VSDPIEQIRSALAERYAVEQEIGSGGMATVYLAEDLKHHRKVAVKMQRPELAAVIGAERFLKEIEVTANLQHPHILQLYDSGRAAERQSGRELLYYVMPFVEGESLRDKLNREKQLSVDESVKIATGVAGALDYAHRHDVIHRDIKPENILLHDGQPVVADFGVALAVSAAAGTRLTETGLSVGTPHYMSPEQASADRELDGRTDVYSLGATLYEMLVGQPPFIASSAQAAVAKLLTETPRRVSAERPTIPPHVDTAIDKALQKLPADRFATAADFGEALVNPSFTAPLADKVAGTPAAAHGLWNRLSISLFAVTVALSLALLWALTRPGTGESSAGTITRLSIPSPQDMSLLFPQDDGFAISLNGQTVVYRHPRHEGSTELRVRHLNSFESHVLRGTIGATSPFFSPDGEWIGFHADGAMRKVALAGGAPQFIASLPPIRNVRWMDNDTIYFSMHAPPALRNRWKSPYNVWYSMWKVAATGGDPVPLKSDLLVPGQHELHLYPEPLPGGRDIIYTGSTEEEFDVRVLSLDTGEDRLLVRSASAARYVPSGHLLYGFEGDLFARPFDTKRREFTGPAVLVAAGLAQLNAWMWYGASAEGTLVFLPGGRIERENAWYWLEPGSANAPVEIPYTRGVTNSASIGPQGGRLLYTRYEGPNHYAFVRDLTSGIERRVSLEEGNAWGPLWLDDGERIVYGQNLARGARLYMAYADGRRAPERLMDAEFVQSTNQVVSSDRILFQEDTPDGLRDIWELSLTTRERRLVVGGPADQIHGVTSPDNRWIAYASDETDRWEVYIRGIDEAATPVQVSTSGGLAPLWSSNGEWLYYLSATGDSVWMVEPPGEQQGRPLAPPTLVLHGEFVHGGYWQRGWGLTDDGRIVVRMPVEDYPHIGEIRVVRGWDLASER
jgi:serine/threonine-protein kinase